MSGSLEEPVDDLDEQLALREAVVDELEAILLADGPLGVDDLADAFARRHPERAADLLAGRPTEELVRRVTAVAQQADAFWRLADERLAPVLHHLRRATFTHRLSADEVGREAIDLFPDVVALAVPRSVTSIDGVELRTAGAGDDERAAEDGSILGPAGWLSSHAVGDLLALRYDGDRLELRAMSESDLDPVAAGVVSDALRRAFDRLDGDRAPELHRLVVEAVGEQPASFAVPVAPVAGLLAPVGLRIRDAWVGPADATWETPPERARRRRLDELLAGADTCCRRSAARALDAWQRWMRDTEGAVTVAAAVRAVETDAVETDAVEADAVETDAVETDVDAGEQARLRADVDHGPVAAALAEVATMGRPLVTVGRLGHWATAISDPDTTAAGVEYLRALGADASGDPLQAEAHLRAGLEVDADHGACLGFLAELLQDRGDAEQSLAVLRRIGRPLSPDTLAELAPFLVDRTRGRNEPCSCGSGRKFKACCLREPRPRPLVERSRWLLGRAIRHAVRSDAMAVQSLRQLFDPSIAGPEMLGLVADLLLFSTPGLSRYLDARGPLLADDERRCAADWVAQPMRLLEIVGVTPGSSFDAIDLHHDLRLHVEDPEAADAVGPGDLILSRPLPVDEAWILSGAVLPIPASGRERALEMLADDVRPFHLLQLLVDLQVDALRS